MDGFRVFYHPGSTRFDTAMGAVIALEQQSVVTEEEARKLLQELLDDGRGGVSLNRPGSTKMLKGKELLDWLAQGAR